MPIVELASESLEQCPAGILVLDCNLKILVWNNWLVQASGIASKHIRGKSLKDVIPALEDSYLLEAIIQALATGLPSVLTPKLNKFPLPLYRDPLDKEKHSFPQNIHVLAIRAGADNERYCLVHISDVSSAIQRESQLRKQADELKEQKLNLTRAWQEAKQANEAKGMFLANVSHEIRTPLNAIIGLSNLSMQDAPAGPIREDLERIEQSGKLLLTLVNDILDFAKIDAGKMALTKRYCETDDIVAQLLDLFRDQANERQLSLIFELDDNVPLQIKTDALRLQQILINLINNALKFTETGEVRIHIRWTEKPDKTDVGVLEISVRDTGIGMNSTEMERLFLPFSQADESTSRVYGGTGLGLAISKRLAELFGGTIQVTSKKGGGSTFALKLPVTSSCTSTIVAPVLLHSKSVCYLNINQKQKSVLQRALRPWDLCAIDANILTDSNDCAVLVCPATAVDALSPQWENIPRIELTHDHQDINRNERNYLLPEPICAQQIRRKIQHRLQQHKANKPVTFEAHSQLPLLNKTIMVAEDNSINRMIAEKILQRMGATVVSAVDGEHALQQIQAHAVDAIFMDIQMPRMDGYTACRKLRQEPYSFTGPIIALTAHAMQDEAQRCRAAGMNAHVSKPYDPEELLKALRHHLDEESAETSITVQDSENAWDALQGLRRINNDIELFKLLLEQFMTQFCLPQGAWDNFLIKKPEQQCSWMHNLQGVAANLGASHLARRAAEIEKMLKDSGFKQDNPHLNEQLRAFYPILSNCCSSMEIWYEKQVKQKDWAQESTKDSPQYVTPGHDIQQKPIAKLLSLLDSQDLAALSLWKQIRVNLIHKHANLTQYLDIHMKNLEFEAAGRQLKQWLILQAEAETEICSKIKGVGA